MTKSCLVCVMRPLAYFNYFSYGFLQLKCVHSKNTTDKTFSLPLILIVHFLLIITIPFLIYLNLTVENFDFFLILTTSELIFMEIDLFHSISDNLNWKWRFQEAQLMSYLWHYTTNFNVEKNHYLLSYKYTLAVITSLVVVNSMSLAYFFSKEMNLLTVANILARFGAGTIISATYTFSLYEYLYYRFIFKWTFEQIERDVRLRLVTDTRMFLIYGRTKLPVENSFVRGMKKHRKRYTTILHSFLRMKKLKRSRVVSLILIHHFLLTLMLFLAFIIIRGQMEARLGHYLYFVKNLVFSLHLGLIFVVCEDINVLWQQLLTVMFKIPLNALTGQESKEVEILTKFLVWEQPTENSRDVPKYKLSLLITIIVDTITNTMVVIQLFFLFADMA